MSLQNELLKLSLKILQGEKIIGKLFVNPRRGGEPFKASRFNSRKFTVTEHSIEGFQLLTLQPKGNESHKNGHILLLHGGGYVMEAQRAHRLWAAYLVHTHQLTCSYFDYPLAPENQYEKTNRLTLEAYKFITQNFSDPRYFLFGDSAGGGLALSILQQLRNLDLTAFPAKTVLVSPWVDLSMENPEIQEFMGKDHVLSLSALPQSVKHYVGNESNLKKPEISPLFGPMENLGSIFLLYGTEEIFFPDNHLLEMNLLHAEGTDLKVDIGKGMVHDWLLFPIPETKKTLDKIANFLLQN